MLHLRSLFMIMLLALVFFLFASWHLVEVSNVKPLSQQVGSWSQATGSLNRSRICSVNYKDTRNIIHNNVRAIYFVTPTYPRPEQVPELTRLSHTLMLVPKIHWIVANNVMECSEEVADILARSGLPYTHIASPNPDFIKNAHYARGVASRLAALSWIKSNVQDGVLYFGDDDNTIDLRLFSEIRKTEKVSMFPVGMIGSFGVSSPIVKDGKVVGFYDSWPASRTFPVDMAGFAVNVRFLKPTATMPFLTGYEEDKFLISLGTKMEDIQPLASNCSRILVWHTRTAKYKKSTVRIDMKKLESIPKFQTFTNLLKETARLGMVTLSATEGVKPSITRNRKTFKTITGLN